MFLGLGKCNSAFRISLENTIMLLGFGIGDKY
jgi:hypothetical protein